MAGDLTVKVNDVVQVIVGLIFTAFGIAMIVVGAIYLNSCPAQTYVPIYLIVAGAFFLSFWLLFPLEFFHAKLRKILSALVAVFLFAWLIAGSVWVFGIFNNSTRACHRSMYLFTFSIIIIQYILLGLAIIFGLIACFCSKMTCCCSCWNKKV
ncbi:hypothetical protein XELAEV_18022307mg [Xenopus laevis]|uniref:MARVEL domain-containing protein n=1 Tax=Xenopus laevis TaxID=8355 RepID=A0A974HN27_XENLA|nr:hypothetical protein XELAEV_18022307mg [Xenopus laevis]